ncbi:MAG TPA: hypothetical protein VJU59_15100 [Paraburkholderia sp.]|nr:hypothetical protein [Paraburkholderia sp.]HKR40980.1 hypothetical protein [Paraburkholderia sp.]
MFTSSVAVYGGDLPEVVLTAGMTLNASASRIVIVIVPLAFIAGAPCG